MRPCVVLVDYENVQPTEFMEVAQAGGHVWFFVGSSQKRVSTDLPDFIARFPSQSRFIRMEKPGKNSSTSTSATTLAWRPMSGPTCSMC